MQIGIGLLLVAALVLLTWGSLRLLVGLGQLWLKRHIGYLDRRHAARTRVARDRIVSQFETQELPRFVDEISGGVDGTGRTAHATGSQPAAARTAAVSERPSGAPGWPTEPGNVPAGRAGGQSGTGRHRRVLAAGTLPASTSRPALPHPATLAGQGLRRAS